MLFFKGQKQIFTLTLSEKFSIRLVHRHLAAANESGQSFKQTECQGPASIDIKIVFQASFLKRAITSFSVATHLSRGIILNIRKSLRRGTNNSMKHFL